MSLLESLVREEADACIGDDPQESGCDPTVQREAPLTLQSLPEHVIQSRVPVMDRNSTARDLHQLVVL